MKFLFSLLFLIETSLSSFSQLIIQPIVWKCNTILTGKPALNFQEATYIDATNFPYYKGSTRLTPGQDISVKLLEYKSEIFPADSLTTITNLNNLPPDFSFSYHNDSLNVIYITLLPLRRNPANGVVERITEFTVSTASSTSDQPWASQSVMRSGKWVKIKITQNGIYKITHSQISNDLGLSNPGNIRIFGYGAGMLSRKNADIRPSDLQEIPLMFNESQPGTFQNGDNVTFYAEGPTKWDYNSSSKMFLHTIHNFSDASYYFITTDLGSAKTITIINSSSDSQNQEVSSFDDFVYHEEELINLCQSGSRWCGETFDSKLTYTFNYSFPNLNTASPGKFRIQLAWQSPSPTSFSYLINGTSIGGISLDAETGTDCFYRMTTDMKTFSPSADQLNLSLTYTKNSATSAKAILDNFDINIRRNLVMSGTQMFFRDINSVAKGNISRFTLTNASSSIVVWNVTKINAVSQIQSNINGSTLSFILPTDSLQTFIAFDKNNLLSPTFLGKDGNIDNQNLHGIEIPNLLIVCHPNFISQAERLASHRRSQGLKVAVVTPQQIYNEFSSGSPDIQSIRDFARMLHDKDPYTFRYMLLFGDGSWDNRPIEIKGNSNYVLAYEMDGYPNFLPDIPVTDDFYGFLSQKETADSGFLDIGIGRIPSSDTIQASAVVDKIIHYDSPDAMGSWRNQICFVADDKEDDGFTFLDDADFTAKEAKNKIPEMNITKIYLDAYKQYISSSGQSCPDAKMALNNAVSSGMIMLNFTGHGGPDGITSENLFNRDVVNTWKNKDRMFMMFTGSCKVTRFDYLSLLQNGQYAPYITAGEYALFKEEGGAVCLVSTNRDTYAGGNINLNNALIQNLVDRYESDNNSYRLGDIYLRAKNIASIKGIYGKDGNTKNFILLGDPSMRLAIPNLNRVITDSVNSRQVSEDTINALQTVTLKGHIASENGSVMSDFNGSVSITIFDKPMVWETIDNHGFGTESFSTQEQIIIKGNASIKNGYFSFRFMTPKDINYNVGSGKISYYAQFENQDINGYDTSIKIGGMNDTLINDTDGPEINLYMNDTTFRNGGITDKNPVLLAVISDPCGINATGASIGHDIIAVLDNNPTNKYILNNYYETNLDNYQSGTIRYPLYDLSPGRNTLTVTVWDALNNSNESEIEFVVTNGEQLILQNILCYPNPMTDHTYFVFDHNMPGEDIKVTVQIYDLSGMMMQTLTAVINSSGYTSTPLMWDGSTAGGANTGNGMFIYRIIAEVPKKGLSATGSGKLIIAQ
jgi:hypothetical protein